MDKPKRMELTKKPPFREQIGVDKETTTIRVPSNILVEMKTEADKIGISVNSYMLITIHMGRKILNSNISFIPDIPE